MDNIQEIERLAEAEARAAQQRARSRHDRGAVGIYHAVRADALQYRMRRLAEDLAARERDLAWLERRLREAEPWQDAGEALAADWLRLCGLYGEQGALRCLRDRLQGLAELYRGGPGGGGHE
ncbi:hypothetical protein [Halorhodospira neutriphila]|uniref:Uncharacterized protein n=1 Tax=Halorhodospira neutriphila TaxID=168379 RepID=A0ABS1E5S8_9GAMM|nr:hypothetical protein [Halorhodospira neutriphila]MBK1727096.1 hypothetical protein [Halorhodospira neutriphila]